MDNTVLKKRLNTFMSAKGTLRRVSDEVIIEVLRAWEAWPGSSKDFYQDLGLGKQQLANLIKKAKKLVSNGIVTEGEFKEIRVETSPQAGEEMICEKSIVLKWERGNVIHFTQVEQLVDFLKKIS